MSEVKATAEELRAFYDHTQPLSSVFLITIPGGSYAIHHPGASKLVLPPKAWALPLLRTVPASIKSAGLVNALSISNDHSVECDNTGNVWGPILHAARAALIGAAARLYTVNENLGWPKSSLQLGGYIERWKLDTVTGTIQFTIYS